MKNRRGREIVVQHNDMLLARWPQISSLEKKIYLKLISTIEFHHEDFHNHSFLCKDLIKEFRIGRGNYLELRDAITRLNSRVIKIDTPEGMLTASLVSSAEYKDGEGTVSLCFDPKLRPYLLQLKNNFTQFELENTFKIRSNYTIRMYEICKYILDHGGSKVFSIEELKAYIGISKKEYPHYANFKNRVITPSQAEMSELTDLSFEYTEIKVSRKVTGLKINVQLNKPVIESRKLPGMDVPEVFKSLDVLESELNVKLAEIEEFEKTGKKQTDKDGYYKLLADLGRIREEIEEVKFKSRKRPRVNQRRII